MVGDPHRDSSTTISPVGPLQETALDILSKDAPRRPRRSTECLLAVGVGMLLLAGCTHGLLGSLPSVDPRRAAEIVVIRPISVVGCGPSLPVTVDGREAYGLACGEHVILTVPEGERIIGVKHWTWYRRDEDTTDLSVAARGRYYLRIDFSARWGPVLNPITEETGRALVEKTTRLNP